MWAPWLLDMPAAARKLHEEGSGVSDQLQDLPRRGENTLDIGETARSNFDKGKEHWVAIQKMNKESPLVEHQMNNHPRSDTKFGMKIEGFYRGPLQCQTREGQLISEYCKGPLMNRRGEWGQNLPPKLSLEDEDKPNPKRKKPREEKPGKRETENATDETPEPKNSGDEEKPADEPPASKKSRKVKKSPMGAPNSTHNIPPPRSQHLSVKQILEQMNKMRHDAK